MSTPAVVSHPPLVLSSLPGRQYAGPQLALLGTWRLTIDGAATQLPLGAQRLLAFLSLRGRSDRAYLAGALWPDSSEEHAHGSLRSLLWRLQKTRLGLVEGSDSSVELSERVHVDVADAITDSKTSIGGGVPELDGSLPAHLIDGELLPGWYDDWVLIERHRLRQLRLHALEALALTLARQRCFALGLEAALAAVRAEPLRESAHRTVIEVHLLEGNVIEAIAQAEYCRRLLRDELGLDPSPLLASALPRSAGVRRPGQRTRYDAPA